MPDVRGCPDYSHHDYAKEAREGREYHRKIGAADRLAGKEPNHYLYYTASQDYHIAAGYRDGYDNPSATQVAEAA
jgi:hypothetical protein